MNREILSLFKLILERNKLAKIRSRRRGRLGRLKKSVFNRTSKITVNHLDELKTALVEYNKSCNELKKFTKSNAKLRKQLQKKYKTKQRTDASNHVTHIYLYDHEGTSETVRSFFHISDMERIVLDEEINGILLEAGEYANSRNRRYQRTS